MKRTVVILAACVPQVQGWPRCRTFAPQALMPARSNGGNAGQLVFVEAVMAAAVGERAPASGRVASKVSLRLPACKPAPANLRLWCRPPAAVIGTKRRRRTAKCQSVSLERV